MWKLSFLVTVKVVLLLILTPLPSNAIGPWALITNGNEALSLVMGLYKALDDFHQEVIKTNVERLTPGQGATLRKLDSIYWDLTELKNDVKSWQTKEEQNRIAKKIDQLLNKLIKIDEKYKNYERLKFNNSIIIDNVVVEAEPETIKNFVDSAVSPFNNEFPEVILDMYRIFTEPDALGDSVLSILSSHNKNADLMSIKKQSNHVLILELFRSVIDADMKGLIVKLYAYDELEKEITKDNPHRTFKYSKTIEKEAFERRVDETKAKVKRFIAQASREIWRTDPQTHQKDVTYAKLQEVFQTYAFYEQDYNELCQATCPDYSRRPFTPQCKTKFCQKHAERKRCHGKLKDCQKIHKTQTYCFAPESSDRRYEWMFTGSNTSYGSYDLECEDTVKIDEAPGLTMGYMGYGYIASECDTCLCTCVSNEQGITRYFSLNPVYADVENNMVVTGIRFIKNDYILSLQIQQGRLAPNGSIDQSSLEWKNETASDDGAYSVDEEHNTVLLDDILYQSVDVNNRSHQRENFIVSGVKLEEMDKSLRLKVSFVPFDYKSGQIYYNGSSRQFYGNNKPKDKRNKISLNESADPTKTYANVLDSIHQQRVEFQLSGLEKDLGQSTIPYIDIQEVVSQPAVPLVGLGLMHKGTMGFGGFLGLKLIQFDYTPYL